MALLPYHRYLVGFRLSGFTAVGFPSLGAQFYVYLFPYACLFLRVITLLCMPECLALLLFYYLFYCRCLSVFGLYCFGLYLIISVYLIVYKFMRCCSAACFAVFVYDIFTFALLSSMGLVFSVRYMVCSVLLGSMFCLFRLALSPQFASPYQSFETLCFVVAVRSIQVGEHCVLACFVLLGR